MNLAVVFAVLEQGLKLWASKESHKYIDQLVKLKVRWHEEYNKPENKRSDVALDAIELHLRVICESFVNASSVTDTKN
jgi:hypothetical protein